MKKYFVAIFIYLSLGLQAQSINRIDTIGYFKGASYTGVINDGDKIIVDGWAIDTASVFRFVNVNKTFYINSETTNCVYNYGGYGSLYNNIQHGFGNTYVSTSSTARNGIGGVNFCIYKNDSIYKKTDVFDNAAPYGPSTIILESVDTSYFVAGGMGGSVFFLDLINMEIFGEKIIIVYQVFQALVAWRIIMENSI